MNWKDRQVLVTGAGGFIASHLVEKLVREGARVRAFTRYNSRNDVGMLKLISVATCAMWKQCAVLRVMWTLFFILAH
jgi:nucleoside-diphosphate-sugar epimerase